MQSRAFLQIIYEKYLPKSKTAQQNHVSYSNTYDSEHGNTNFRSERNTKMKLTPGEKILRKYRQTKAILVGYLLACSLAAYVPVTFLTKYELKETFGKIPEFWIFFTAIYFINQVLLWKMNYTLVTNNRLIIIQYHNLLHKIVTDLPKDKIVNIAYEKKGLFAALFDYGNVVVQQQSISNPVVLKHLPQPSVIKDDTITLIKAS
jgi:hypothetical protein